MTTGSEMPITLCAAYPALHRRSDMAFARSGVTADQFVLIASLARGATPSPSGNSPAACRPTPAPSGANGVGGRTGIDQCESAA